MNFDRLVEDLGRELGIELECLNGACGIDMDGATIILQQAGGARGDILIMRADLGELPQQRKAVLMQTLLEANHLFRGTGGATIAIDPDSGRLNMMRYDWLDRLDGRSAFEALEKFAATISAWQRTIADFSEASAPAPDEQGDAFALGGNYMSV